MSFYAQEIANESGSPIRLYEFNRESLYWYYTNADRNITWNGNVYLAIPISDGGITQAGEAQSNVFTITLPSQNPVVAMYRLTPPSDSVYVTVRNTHEFDEAMEAPVQWVGYITDCGRPTLDSAQLSCSSISASFQRPGLRLTWMRSCPHSLYDRNCRVDKAAYAQIATVDSLTGTSLAVGGLAGFADEWFSGGFLEWQIAAGVYERRGIERSTDDGSLLMFGTTDGITAGLTITAYPGCMRNIATCNTKFGNSDNYGGIPALPGRSPFDGNPVFEL